MIWNRRKGEVLGKHLSSDLEISALKIGANNRLPFSTMKSPVCDLCRTRALGSAPFSFHAQQVPSHFCHSSPSLTPKAPISNRFDEPFTGKHRIRGHHTDTSQPISHLCSSSEVPSPISFSDSLAPAHSTPIPQMPSQNTTTRETETSKHLAQYDPQFWEVIRS